MSASGTLSLLERAEGLVQGHTRVRSTCYPGERGRSAPEGIGCVALPADFLHMLRAGYSGNALGIRVLRAPHTWRPVVANEAPPNARSPLTARAAAPIEDNRRRTVGSFTTSIVGKLFTTRSSSLVEASAHHRYRPSSRAWAHLPWLVGKHTLETSG